MQKKPINPHFSCQKVKEKFAAYPADIHEKLTFLRQLIFNVARQDPQIGVLEETLKWGEPSYYPAMTKSGTAIRIDWKENTPTNYYIFFRGYTR